MSKRKPYSLSEPSSDGPLYWSSPDDLEAQLSRDPVLKARLDAAAATEFGPGDAEGAFSDPVSRRNFLTLMSASIGLATLEGCRRPVEHILPYTRHDEHVNIGVPNHYATVANHRGEAVGLLVESHEGRPTKIEGNPEHPASLGAADLQLQASVLGLYDPDRSRKPVHREGNAAHERTYAQFDEAFAEVLRPHVETRGQGLRVLTLPSISPTFLRLRSAVLERMPSAKFYTYEPAGTANNREGLRLAFGSPVNAVHALARAKVVLSLDADFLQTEAASVRNTRDFSDARRLRDTSSAMARLYMVESTYSTTGSNADHRLRLAAKDIGLYLVALANRLATSGVDLGPVRAALRAEAPAGVPAKWLDAVASDLAHNPGECVILVGQNQPPWVHALAAAVNHGLNNAGRTVSYHPAVDSSEQDHTSELRALCEEIGQNGVQTLVILGCNPVYDAPADLDFAAKLGQVRATVHVGTHIDETGGRCTWHLPKAHYLESWGDARGLDGTVAIQQPLIAPLHGAKSELEVLTVLAGVPRSGYEQVRETLRTSAAAAVGGFERAWRRVLHRGYVEGSAVTAVADPPRFADIAQRVTTGVSAAGASPTGSNLEVTFRPCPKMGDGRWANVPWLQELNDPITKITWDNAALFSPALARDKGIANGDKVRLAKGNRSVEIVAWIVPGMPDNSIALTLGWGRRRAGRVGTEKGFDVYPLRTAEGLWFTDGVTVTKTGATYPISQTQEHQRMEGRPLALDATLSEYRATPNFAERRSHTPRTLPLWREVEYNGYKWGMVIDLNACTGCNACVIACQSENNIPVVGKDQVSRGREMYWLRIDRYFVSPRGQGDHDALATSDPAVAYQPVACVQCEEAPCENVCPVNATAHSPEGLNDMAYNRCIGTRYCANNCPYKVRRFNYLNWQNDGPWQETVGEWLADANVPETLRMQHNPNVSVRFRGVMEKCTYCVQRIQTAKIQAKNEYRTIRDGEVTTACAQTCPAKAITFGDLNDRESAVVRAYRTDRRFMLLAELGTQPRTSYLAKVRNPNPEMQG